jgi:hypothetical protein
MLIFKYHGAMTVMIFQLVALEVCFNWYLLVITRVEASSCANTISCSKFGVLATRKGQDKGSGTSVKELPRDKTFKMKILN